MNINIRHTAKEDFGDILAVINDAAEAYRQVIPADRWKDPYMAEDELRRELAEGVIFWCAERDGKIVGVMGVQEVEDVTLIRHAYVLSRDQRQGIGGRLLETLKMQGNPGRPLLVGTWSNARWAIRFYRNHGFELLARAEIDRLLRRYWSIPERQIETSVVLAGTGGG